MLYCWSAGIRLGRARHWLGLGLRLGLVLGYDHISKSDSDSHPRRVRVVARKGLKWDNFRWWMKGEGGAENVGGLYRGIWVPDDDMRYIDGM
eukprot:1392049-Amorphochlora_amoeboformis.AAC.1